MVPMSLDPESRKRPPEVREESPIRKAGVVPAPKAAGPTKRRPEDQGVREKARLAPSTVDAPEAEQMDDAPAPLDLGRKKAEKRRASTDVVDRG